MELHYTVVGKWRRGNRDSCTIMCLRCKYKVLVSVLKQRPCGASATDKIENRFGI